MNDLIAKKYAKAVYDFKKGDVEFLLETLKVINSAFYIQKGINIISSPIVPKEKKLELILSLLDSKDETITNLLKLLAEKNRLELIPHIYLALQKLNTQKKRVYEGVIYGEELDEESIKRLSESISTKVGAEVVFKMVPSDYDGIKAVVEELDIEIAFSRERLKNDLTEHILKAI